MARSTERTDFVSVLDMVWGPAKIASLDFELSVHVVDYSPENADEQGNG
jgi:hypothetical protein